MESVSTRPLVTDHLIEQMPCGYLVFNDEGEIVFANNTIAALLHTTVGELAGNKFERLLTVAGKIFYQTHYFPLLKLQDKAEEIFLTLVASDNVEVPVLTNTKRVNDQGVYQNHCVLMSVHQRKKYEEELIDARRTLERSLNKNELLQQTTRELEQSKADLDKQVTRLANLNEGLVEFSNVIAHDIQEPIRKISMFADIIFREDKARLSEVSKVSVDKIKALSRRMRDLVSCLQQYVSVDTTNKDIMHCDLDDVLARAKFKALIDTGFPEIGLTVKALPEIEGNCAQLELMFYHLFSNAIQFRKEGGRVCVSVESDIIQQNSYKATQGKYKYIDFVRIRFADTSRGFDNRYNDYVFGLFKKAHPDTEGLGFGLALCKKIVDNHYGAISAQSSLQSGTIVTILLPIRQLDLL